MRLYNVHSYVASTVKLDEPVRNEIMLDRTV